MNEQQLQQEKGWKKIFDWPTIMFNNNNSTNKQQPAETQQPGQPAEQQLKLQEATVVKEQDFNTTKSITTHTAPSLIESSSSTISFTSIDTMEQVVKSSSDLSIHSSRNKSISVETRRPLKKKEGNVIPINTNGASIKKRLPSKIPIKIPAPPQAAAAEKAVVVESLPVTVKKSSKAPSIEKNIKQIQPDWKEHPNAWGYLHAICGKSQYLEYRSNDRKGYLIGSDSSCDIQIISSILQPRHCLIYAENYTNLNNESSIRVNLKDLSDDKFPTITSVKSLGSTNYIVVEKNSKESRQLENEDIIKIKCPRTNGGIYFQLELNPNALAKTFRDEYKLGPCLGRGAFSEVYIAKLRNKGVHHIVKAIYKDRFKHQTKALQQFTQEISILMLLEKHPGIVGIVKVYDENKVFQIVMDYISEGDLFDFIVNSGSLTEYNTKIIFHQLFTTVKFLHDAGIVHRDLKPENIMMASKADLQVKICDFGLATLHQNSDFLTSQCGTDDYVAPEILNLNDSKIRNLLYPQPELNPTDAYGKECDLWSLGVILYSCLCGKPPFYDRDQGPNSKKQCILRGEYDFNDPAWKHISDEAKDLVQGLLTVKRSERLTIDKALDHAWIKNMESSSQCSQYLRI